ncbi:MAG: alanine--tRNA ligase [Acidilobus sp.]
MVKIDPSEYRLKVFQGRGYQRKRCAVGGDYFWTLNPDFETCQDVPDTDYWFDKIPSGPPLTVREVRSKFIEFFKERGHEPIPPRPVIARWREDLYLTIASIVVFQPHVTSGLVPPPANPLVISQPCIRLEDIDNVGLTIGRHLTTFEMAAHHAFNYPDKHVYWKDETIAYAKEFFTKEIGIPEDLLVFKESWWEGGGNAGPSFEVTIGGLELATLVFMQYKVINGEAYEELPLKIVDTGYGVERIAWFTQKTPTAFHAIYGNLVDEVRSRIGFPRPDNKVLWAAFRNAAKLNPDDLNSLESYYRTIASYLGADVESVRPILEREARLYSVLDHSKTITLMLADGVVPSNSGEGYLARLVIRRALRQLRQLSQDYSLADIVERQIQLWRDDFPQVITNRDYILDAVMVEEQRYRELLTRGERLVTKELSRTLTLDDLIRLYDSLGVPPEIVAEVAAKRGIRVHVPQNFYSIVAARHRAPTKVRVVGESVELPQEVMTWVQKFPPTELLFHKDPYTRTFRARLLGALGEYFVLDSTAFYATGGGQVHDTGTVRMCRENYKVIDVVKVGGVIVHRADRPIATSRCDEVEGEIDWVRRFRLMRHHTATHIVLGAARRVLGNHVWQAGAEKTPEKARLDITHHRGLGEAEVREIERLANEVIDERRPVRQFLLERNEAERKYGFTLYEGGVPMERNIRVVEVEGWDAEACFGTHVNNTGEIGGIKITNAERIQDGIIRLEFVAGTRVYEEMAKVEDQLRRAASELGVNPPDIISGVKEVKEEIEGLREAVKKYRFMWLSDAVAKLRSQVPLGGVKVAVLEYPERDLKSARESLRRITDEVPDSLVLLAVKENKGYHYEVGVGKEAASLDVGQVIRKLIDTVGGQGGGRGTYGSLVTGRGPEEIEKALPGLIKGLAKGA